MSKTLLVLAGSTYQIPTIEKAKRLGYRVITADNNPGNPGHLLADASFNVSTVNVDEIISLAARENISGVISPGTDVAVLTAACVAESLGLPGPPSTSARVLTEKRLFRRFLESRGFHSPTVLELSEGETPNASVFDGTKWLLKPNRASGSKGTFIITSQVEFENRINESRSESLDSAVLLEEYIEGTQHSCEGILLDGRIVLSLITDRDTAKPPFTTTIGHRVPTRLSNQIQKFLTSDLERLFSSLEIFECVFDCDFVAKAESVLLIEVTPRLGGNSLSRLIAASLDFDLITYAIQQACGDDKDTIFQNSIKPCSIQLLGVKESGALTWDADEAEKMLLSDWLQFFKIDYVPGTHVMPFINGRCRVGEALIVANHRDDLDHLIEQFHRRLCLTVW